MRIVNRRHCYQIACSAHPTSTAVTGFFSGKVKRVHAWILYEEKEGNIFSWILMSKLYPVTLSVKEVSMMDISM